MADAYWRYGDARQPPPSHSLVGKRPRSDFDLPGGHEPHSYYSRNDDRISGMRGSDSIGASYDEYLRNGQITSYGGRQSSRPVGGGLPSHHVDDARVMGVGSMDPMVKERSMGFGMSEIPLPRDASSTLYVEGLPSDCSRREVSHIFRPFVGYKEVRLVSKEARHSGREPLTLCFVDFLSPAHAATAMDAIQGYRFDEHDRDSIDLRLQFARHPGTRSGGGHRGNR